MNIKNYLFLAGFAGLSMFASCTKDDPEIKDPPVTNNDQIPAEYSFANTNYKGQTVRLMLADSMMKIIKGLDKSGAPAVTKAQLEQFYDNSGNYFTDISTDKKLSDKIFGGKGGTMDNEIRNWFDTIAVRSTQFAGSKDAFTTADGLVLSELIEKNIMGGVFYYQALNYLNDAVPVADNATVKEGEGTKMEHNWDEAFGYFGAAREYNKFSDDEIAKNPSQKDANNDGRIDLGTEKNFFFGRYAGNRDKNYTVFTNSPTDYSKEIFDAFRAGRYYIGKKDYAKRDEAAATIKSTWDKIIASSAVHYAVGIKNNISNPSSNYGRWAELKTFVEMTQFNSANKLGVANYTEIKNKLGSKPADINAEKIDAIISILKNAYGF